MERLSHNRIFSLESVFNFELRPQGSHGLWVMFLLPLALIVSALQHDIALTSTYRLLPFFSIGLILTSICIINSLDKEDFIKVYELWFFIPISLSLYHFLHSGVLFSLYSGIMCTFIYYHIFLSLIRIFPRSFTIGEAGLTSQSFTIVLYMTLLNIYKATNYPFETVGQSSTITIQMELLAILVLGIFLKYSDFEHNITIYFWTFFIVLITFLLPLHIMLNKSPILWILSLLIKDYSTMKMIAYWIICSCLAALVVLKKQNESDKVTSSERKIFHLLAAAVYIPGLIHECNLLYLGSGLLLGIFFLLEILRNFRIPPFGALLQASFMALSDEKDAGNLAVTPIYLLCGFTLPLWIHPAPCDVTDSSFFNLLPLLSGILTVGIGDTAASVFGSKYGKYYYKDSKKTIEGTLASIVSQLVVIYILFRLDLIVNLNIVMFLRILVAVVFSSIVEAKTDQIDNGVLPLIMYILLV